MSGSRRTERPAWWSWELELSSHTLKRMVDRRFTEVDLRSMVSAAMNLRETSSLAAGSWEPHMNRGPGR